MKRAKGLRDRFVGIGVRSKGWEGEFSLCAEGAGVLSDSGATGVDEFNKKERVKERN
jgi:hypothetical protein